DAGDFGEVAEASELRHKRDAGAGGCGHGTGTCPSCAENHADGGELVLRLDNGETGFAIFLYAVGLHVFDEVFDNAGRRRDRVPGDDGDAGEHRAHGGGRVAVNNDLALGGAHGFDDQAVLLGEGVGGVVVAKLHSLPVEVGYRDLLGKLL